MRIHRILKEAAAVFSRHGKQAYLVGGAVRDMLRNREPGDWDLATDARPDEVMAFFPRVIPTGMRHGTVTVRYKGRSIEVTTFRCESEYTDGRRPGRVEFTGSIEEDLSRRDFTMNALALELPGGRLVDPFGGAEDIGRGLIRCVGAPGERFAEDGLRPLRALRFAAQLGFAIDQSILEAIPGAIPTVAKVSPERIRDELNKILGSPVPSRAFIPMEQTGLLGLLLPELASCRGVEQKGFHRFDVLDHSILACDYAARIQAAPAVRLAALFHDVGKPVTRKPGGTGLWTFYRHERESARLAQAILRRYRYPALFIESVVHLIAEHMFHYDETWSDAAVRRFIIRAGEANLPELYDLRRADAYAATGTELPRDFLAALIRRVDLVLAGSRAFSLRDLAVSGRDLITLGIPPGKRLGIILGELLETVVDDPAQNTREKLLDIAAALYARETGNAPTA